VGFTEYKTKVIGNLRGRAEGGGREERLEGGVMG